MHVRLIVFQARGLAQQMKRLVFGDGIWRYVQAGAEISCRIEERQEGSILGNFTLGIQVHGQLGVIANLLADRVKVQFPPDMRTGQL